MTRSTRLDAIIQAHDDVLDAMRAAAMVEEYGTAIEIGHLHGLLLRMCIGCGREFADAAQINAKGDSWAQVRHNMTFRIDRVTQQLVPALAEVPAWREAEVVKIFACISCTTKISRWAVRGAKDD